MGVARAVKDYFPPSILNHIKFTGASSGSLIAAALATGVDLDRARNVIHKLRIDTSKHVLGPVGKCSRYVREGITEMLPIDSYKFASDRLHISITETNIETGTLKAFPFLKNSIVSRFSSDEELIKCLLASCYVPFYYETPVIINNKLCIDGGFSNNNPKIDASTIMVSPYSTSQVAHIKPKNSKFNALDAFFFLPSLAQMNFLELQGYHDALSFFNQHHSLLP